MNYYVKIIDGPRPAEADCPVSTFVPHQWKPRRGLEDDTPEKIARMALNDHLASKGELTLPQSFCVYVFPGDVERFPSDGAPTEVTLATYTLQETITPKRDNADLG